jgi:hypothetical protein
MQLKINPIQITFIQIHYKTVSTKYEYLEEIKKSFWSNGREAGFYHWYDDGIRSIEDIEKDNHMVIDKKVYYKPHVKIYLSDKNKHEYFFESKEELDKFMKNSELKNINWIYK